MSENQREVFRKRNSIDHIFHVWINQRQEERRQAGQEHESSLYEFKAMLAELRRLPVWLKAAREGTLRTVHVQCSHTAPEPIQHNVLRCAFGTDVTECAILRSLYATFAEYGQVKFYADVLLDDVDGVAASVCCWHVFMDTIRRPHALDTSEGYVQDEGDRRFWATTYRYLIMDPEELDDDSPIVDEAALVAWQEGVRHR